MAFSQRTLLSQKNVNFSNTFFDLIGQFLTYILVTIRLIEKCVIYFFEIWMSNFFQIVRNCILKSEIVKKNLKSLTVSYRRFFLSSSEINSNIKSLILRCLNFAQMTSIGNNSSIFLKLREGNFDWLQRFISPIPLATRI